VIECRPISHKESDEIMSIFRKGEVKLARGQGKSLQTKKEPSPQVPTQAQIDALVPCLSWYLAEYQRCHSESTKAKMAAKSPAE